MEIDIAWYSEEHPDIFIIEHDKGIGAVSIVPYRQISSEDMSPYNGQPLNTIKKTPVPDYVYAHYGLTKNKDALKAVEHVRMTHAEHERLVGYAKSQGMRTSEAARSILKDFLQK